MIDFLIKSSASLFVFLTFYHLVLEREKIHRFNRFYLLFSIVISLVIPFLSYQIIEIIPVQTSEPVFIPELEYTSSAATIKKVNYIPILFWSLYGIITALFMFRFVKNVWKLIQKTKSNATANYKNATLVLVDKTTLPHSFFNFIFINFDDYNNRTIEDELYTHELVHVTQKHTLDILFIELLKCVFWFNPLFYFYKKAIQLNHEFLADEKVVTSYNNVTFYQNLLLQKSSNAQTIYLASNLNYLVTKKRLLMMTKNTSKTIATIKKVAVIPMLVGLIYFFCIEIVAQEKTITLSKKTVGENTSTEDKIRDSYYSNVRIILKDLRKNISINKMYEELTLEEKRSYLSWVPDMYIEKEVPELLFEKMKTKNMAVWINNKLSSKEQIKNYKRTDFTYYTYSFVHKNARSKRFPQEYQYTLYTTDFFDKNLKNSHLHFSNDTIKLVISDYKKAAVNKELSKNIKADTLVWYTQGQKEYNLEVKSSDKSTTRPDFKGGISKFYDFLAKNYKTPEEARKNKINGRVFVSFFVEEDGSLSEIKLIKDLKFGTGEEAIRVLKICPKWIPGEIDGKKTRMIYSLPIKIQSE